ncbi:MAG: stage III sporulation protein AF [Lachnospiraceae bacterium]|nr:stage III sporulation protein AF [Lachnospiraceae bacterium]
MLTEFYGWIKTIAACLIFMSLVLRLLPEGKNVKYIRHFMGMLLVLVVLAPLGKLFRLEEAFASMELSLEQEHTRNDFRDELSLMGEAYTDEIVGGYEEDLAGQVLKFLKNRGYGEMSVRVKIDANQESASFGQVESLEVFPLEGGEKGTETGRIVIEKKNVQILSEEGEKKSYLEEAEDGELRKLLSGEFSLPEEAVRIVR